MAVGWRPDTSAAGVAGADASKSSAFTVVVSPTLLEICLPDMPDMPDMTDTRDMAPAIPRPVRASQAAVDISRQRLAGRSCQAAARHQQPQGCRGCR